MRFQPAPAYPYHHYLSILFMRFSIHSDYSCIKMCTFNSLYEIRIYKSGGIWKKNRNTFNSLYEILMVACVRSAAQGILSILFMRFLWRAVRLSLTGMPGRNFQFSLWDSQKTRYHMPHFSRISFNSLYEIRKRCVYGCFFHASRFQFSLWDSTCSLQACSPSAGLTFNSLYEIQARSCRSARTLRRPFNSLYEILMRAIIHGTHG